MNVKLAALVKAWRDEAAEPRFPSEEDRDAVEAFDKALNRCADELAALLPSAADEPRLPPEAVQSEAGSMLGAGVWAIPSDFGCRVVDERMAYGWNECRKAMRESRPASARPRAGAGEWPARWFASGPQGEFFAVSLKFAEALIADLAADRDDWTITDLSVGDTCSAPVAPAAEGWQPIASAPKSSVTGNSVGGVYLLGFIPDASMCDDQATIDVIWWEPLLTNKQGSRGKWCASSFGDAVEVTPSHWQPLPAAPTTAPGAA